MAPSAAAGRSTAPRGPMTSSVPPTDPAGADPSDPAAPPPAPTAPAPTSPAPPAGSPTSPAPSSTPSPRPGRPGAMAGGVAALALVAGLVLGVGIDRTGIFGPVSVPSPAPTAIPATPAPSGSPTDPGASPTTGSADPSATPAPSPLTEDEAFALVRQAWDLLHDDYVGRDELDERALAYGAIDGLAAAVGDTGHTGFETPEDREASNDALQGSYVGIGIVVEEHDDGLMVGGVFPRSPAADAGLGVGDVILEVDGTALDDLTVTEAGNLIRGPEGSRVRLRVDPAGPPGARAVTLSRERVEIPTVEWSMVPGSTLAHVRLFQFSSGATDALREALEEAKAAGATGIVLDLRGNPGGFVDEAVGVASQFLADGNVYLTEDAEGTRTPAPVREGGVATDLPLVVLVDRSTASSAEIVASALQEAGRATIIGEPTFGTGTVVAEYPLADGSALRIGTVRWLTPSGRAIWHEGLDPDVEAALPDGVDAVSPEQLEELGTAGLAASEDVVLLEGLRRLGWRG